MWFHPATQRNLLTLEQDGVLIVGPNDGAMACGEYGPGRMAEPLEIVAAVEDALCGVTILDLPPAVAAIQPGSLPRTLAGIKVIVTSGPTHEPIDPVRYIANQSSGKQGHAIAQAAAEAGAIVTLISGPVSLPDPPGLEIVHVATAREMLAAVEHALPSDLFIAAAAVADWRPVDTSLEKLKKQENAPQPPVLTLTENPDILATIGHRTEGRPKLVVGFAAETEHLLDYAAAKLARKGCDIIIANDVSPEAGVMGGDSNTVHILTRDGVEAWPTLPKTQVARRLVAYCAAFLTRGSP
jgi:phosphopantothenoylcysteine decarboxylase/phosphopantothenate--cysteine ligase